MKNIKFAQGTYTQKDFEPKTLFRSPSVRGHNKGKKYYTKKIDQLFYNMVYGILFFIVIIGIVSVFSTAHTKKYNEIMNQLKTASPLVMDEFRTHVVKAEGVVIESVEKDGKGVEETVEQTIRRIAKENNFKYTDYLVRLAFYESSLNPKAINHNTNGTTDHGVFQWNDKAHPEVSRECAYSVECSTLKTMDAINSGHQSWWVADAKARK